MKTNAKAVLFLCVGAMITSAAGYFVYRAQAQQPNRPPVAVPDSVSVHASTVTPAGANALTNDSDPDGDNLTVTYTTTTYTQYGSGNVGWNGHIGATGGPNPGTMTIPYTVTDGRGGSASSYVTVNVVNSAPTAVTDFYFMAGTTYVTRPEERPIANDYDNDGDLITVSYQSLTNLPNGAGTYSIGPYGDLSVYRYANFVGSVTIG